MPQKNDTKTETSATRKANGRSPAQARTKKNNQTTIKENELGRRQAANSHRFGCIIKPGHRALQIERLSLGNKTHE